MEGHGYAVSVRTDSERAYRRAIRHSRRVRLLRVAIPVGIVLLLAGLTLASWLDPLRMIARLPTDHAGVVISGSKITMAQPKISGYTRDGRWYEFTARSAAQDITKPDLIELRDLRAKIDTQDKGTVDLSATEGLFDRKGSILTLKRDIVVKSASYEVLLDEAVVDTASGDIVSNKPVEVLMLQGTLNAKRLEVIKSGETVRFDGGVTLTLPPTASAPGDQPQVKR